MLPLKIAETKWHSVPPMTAEAKKASMGLLSELAKKEQAKALSARTKNELESYIITMKGELEESEAMIKVRAALYLDRVSALTTISLFFALHMHVDV